MYVAVTILLSLISSLLLFYQGFSTDGEFNSLRTKGEKRPISVIEIAKAAKKVAKSAKATDLSGFFTLNAHGNICISVNLVLSLIVFHKFPQIKYSFVK